MQGALPVRTHHEVGDVGLRPVRHRVLAHVAPVLLVPQAAVLQGHADGSVQAVVATVNGPGVHADGAAQGGRAAHKLCSGVCACMHA